MGKVFQDKPITEITLRKFERPFNEDKNNLIRKFIISLGLLQPGDSRDVIVDIFKLFLESKKTKLVLTSKEIEEKVKNVRSEGTTSSNVRRQILRLEHIGLVEKNQGGYRIKEFSDISYILEEHVRQFLVEPTLKRISEYAKEIDSKF
jgi:predicted transcriptional regulator